jgi:catechol 2,3-dioxygenase-like lactoylglutathione lyase family enzyme
MITGLHHVTAIASNPQANLDFYAGILGLRLVKRTVNFDDPGTYHFYFGDRAGTPGSIITFFPWPNSFRGRRGTGQATVTAFEVPQGSLDRWAERLKRAGVETFGRQERFGEELITCYDPDHMEVELIASGEDNGTGAISRIHSVTLTEEGYERTANLFTGLMGLRLEAESGNRFRYSIGAGGAGATVDVVCAPDAGRGTMGTGTIHHIAWRTPGDAEQAEWRRKIVEANLNVSPVMDRQYFRSIYFREPGGVLFEIATDPPGFATDESPEHLGEELKLPPWLEPMRESIERRLPKIKLPGAHA